MVLALRGWGYEEFELATREFRDAVRFGVFAEKAAGLLVDLDAVAAMSDAGLDLTTKAKLVGARLAAQKEAAQIRAILVPEDEERTF